MLALFGIHDASQIEHFNSGSRLGRRRPIAIDLIDAIEQNGDAVLRSAFFERLVDSRGVYKRTYRGRFDAFDALILDQLAQDRTKDVPLHALDAAVSDGSSTLGLFDGLQRVAAGEFTLIATDVEPRYVVLRANPRSSFRVIATPSDEIVQVIAAPFVVGHPRLDSRFRYPVNRLIRPALTRRAQSLIARKRTGQIVDTREIVVAHPEFRKRLQSDPRLRLETWNILERWSGPPAHLVRAMNIVNPNYFNDAQLRRIVTNLVAALEEGGLVAIGSNADAGSVVDGTIWMKRDGRLVERARSGGGCRAAGAIADLTVAP